MLVHDSSNRGKGSPTYVDSARLLGAAELKTIDEFITQTHSEGGSLSVRQIADELNSKHPAVLISNSAIRYALIHYLGYSWGDVKLRKCQSDPDRVDVKRTYLVDFARALKMQDVDKTHVMVFLDDRVIYIRIMRRSDPGASSTWWVASTSTVAQAKASGSSFS